MLVMKFGGSSVATAEKMTHVAALARKAREKGALVVLSAMGKTTDALFASARTAQNGDLKGALAAKQAIFQEHHKQAELLFDGNTPPILEDALAEMGAELELLLRGVALLRELSPRSMDAIASLGERLSTRIFAAYLNAPWLDARQVMRTDSTFGCGQPQIETLDALVGQHWAGLLGPGKLAVTQGYIGANAEGLTTTLGRGGSDYSAALFGASMGAEEIQIWTDVEGVLTCDPRIVPQARPIPELSFAEAAELSAFGAKVLHPATIEPAIRAGIPVTVRHTMMPDGKFTTIRETCNIRRSITALASRGPVTILTVTSLRMLNQSGFLARLFEVFQRNKVSVDLIATAEVSVSLTVDADAPIDTLVSELSSFASVKVSANRTIVALVGETLKYTPGVTGQAFSALRNINVEMISMGATESNLSILVCQTDAAQALRQLHAAIFEENQEEGTCV